MRLTLRITTICTVLTVLSGFSLSAISAPVNKVDPNIRCAVCGMFVAKYDNWITQIRLSDDSVKFFDGTKDMMVYYYHPDQYGQAKGVKISEIWVKDYYSMKWIAGRMAFFVYGSNVYGPMGKEFIPFADRAAAENFLQDHHGKKIVLFSEITDSLVESMRSGMKMQHQGK